ncbi:hypothetical protein SAMN05428978_10996 [Nitrosomonas sp. Nm34]|nr:hypothetical protein SAMN05428978_10996 [Nitrosomonas sp. Nm34]
MPIVRPDPVGMRALDLGRLMGDPNFFRRHAHIALMNPCVRMALDYSCDLTD